MNQKGIREVLKNQLEDAIDGYEYGFGEIIDLEYVQEKMPFIRELEKENTAQELERWAKNIIPRHIAERFISWIRHRGLIVVEGEEED